MYNLFATVYSPVGVFNGMALKVPEENLETVISTRDYLQKSIGKDQLNHWVLFNGENTEITIPRTVLKNSVFEFTVRIVQPSHPPSRV